MGTKIKEINTLSFIGHLAGRPAERVWKELDEENDIINCRDTFDRECILLKPLEVLRTDLPGDTDAKQITVFSNDKVRIVMVTGKSTTSDFYQQGVGQDTVQIQVENKRTTRTPQGDFELDEGDLLVVPSGLSFRDFGGSGNTRLVVYARNPLQIAKEFPVQDRSKLTRGSKRTSDQMGRKFKQLEFNVFDDVKDWSEIEESIADSSAVVDRECLFLEPKKVVDDVEEGQSGGKHFELVENEDVLIETTIRSDSQRIYHRGFKQDEIAFQLSGRRATRTNQGEFMLETGDMLWIPPGTSHRNIGDMLTTRIIIYTKDPVQLSPEYTDRVKCIEEMKTRKPV